jgi:DNA phosphorothioation-dependent restriction protein DptG
VIFAITLYDVEYFAFTFIEVESFRFIGSAVKPCFFARETASA